MNLETAVLEEWNGYLLLLVDGNIFMADSRQRYTHDIGVPQYEWYYIEGVGVYDGQYPEYTYAASIFEELQGASVHYCTKCKKGAKYCTCGNDDNIVELPIRLANAVYYADTNETKDLTGTVVNAPDDSGNATTEVFDEGVTVQIGDENYTLGVYFTVHEVYDFFTGDLTGYEAYLCEGKGNHIGGVFRKATTVKSMFDNIFFGTENGVVCSFNFDSAPHEKHDKKIDSHQDKIVELVRGKNQGQDKPKGLRTDRAYQQQPVLVRRHGLHGLYVQYDRAKPVRNQGKGEKVG